MQLLYLEDRLPALGGDLRFVEALLIPFHRHGRPIGTVSVVMHQFDRDGKAARVARDVLSRGTDCGLWKLTRQALSAILTAL
jgi:hypothetical protein